MCSRLVGTELPENKGLEAHKFIRFRKGGEERVLVTRHHEDKRIGVDQYFSNLTAKGFGNSPV